MGEYKASSRQTAEPEAKVLIIMTGGTICMQKSPDGLVPARGFLETCMSPRPEFNDGTILDDIDVKFDDDPGPLRKVKSLRTPTSTYGKRVR
jgi:60kDa lysophospholipase